MASSRVTEKEGFYARLLRVLNLRPEESTRTLLMFLAYSAMSIGVLWLESAATGLFLAEYGADNLPFIYLSSTLLSILLGVVYSGLQMVLPLRWSLVAVALLMAFPVLLLQRGLMLPTGTSFVVFGVGLTAMKVVAIGARLWIQVVYVLNDLNTTITANQLFNVRELRRTYPLISSGVLVADAAGGFVLSAVSDRLGASGVILTAFSMMIVAAFLLLYITQSQSRFFDTSSRRRESNTEATQQLRGQAMNYRWLLLLFFVLTETLFWLMDFQFSKELEIHHAGNSERIVGFLGLFQGILGTCELLMQGLVSRWLIDRLGVFTTMGILPAMVLTLGSWITVMNVMPGLLPIASASVSIFWSVVVMKFLYELFHFTILASVGPVLFQPIPPKWRNIIQSKVRGQAEPFANAIVALMILGLIWVAKDSLMAWRSVMFPTMLGIASIWLVTIFWVRKNYEAILVLSARQELLSGHRTSPAALRELKRAAVNALSKPGMEDSRIGCVELLIKIDRSNALEVLAPMLQNLPQESQVRILELMQEDPKPEYSVPVSRLINLSKPAPVIAAALRYVFLHDPNANLQQLNDYLRPQAPPSVRATAAALLLELGDRDQRAQVTNFLRLMLTNTNVEQRRASCEAIRHLKYLQALQLYVREIVAEETEPEVRCAVLDVVAMTHFEKCYPALIDALHHAETRASATRSLVYLENEALPLLTQLVKNWREPDSVRNIAWNLIGQIGTTEAVAFLIQQLPVSWSADRSSILRALIKVPKDQGIDRTADQLGRSGIEALVDHDLMLISHTTAAILDINGRVKNDDLADMLCRALQGIQTDCIDRIFLLMQFLYEPETIQAAAFGLRSGMSDDMAQGLEIIDTKLDIPQKRSLLMILENWIALASRSRTRASKELMAAGRSSSGRLSRQDQRDLERQLQSLSGLVAYQPMEPLDRLRHIMDLRHFLSDWVLACCFHLARAENWQLERHQVLDGLRGGSSLLRESAMLYLHNLSQRGINQAAFLNVLPRMQNDLDPLLQRQVRIWMEEYQRPAIASQTLPLRPRPEADLDDDIPGTEIFGYKPRSDA